MIRALIFDLDNCLAAANEVGEQLVEPAFAAIRAANRGTLSEAALSEAISDARATHSTSSRKNTGFSDRDARSRLESFSSTAVETPMKGYDDLDVLRSCPRALLVTSSRRLQESKIKALKFEHLFAGSM